MMQRVAHFQLDARIDSLNAVVAQMEVEVAELWILTLVAIFMLALVTIAADVMLHGKIDSMRPKPTGEASVSKTDE